MSNQTSKTKNKANKDKTSNTQDKARKGSYIPLPGGRKLPMNVTRWIMFVTLCILLLIVLISMPSRIIRNNLMSATSREEVIEYCTEKKLNCYFTTLSDYDIEGYHVARVSFLPDDFFGEEALANAEQEGSEATTNSNRNVYITVQKGKKLQAAK